MKNLYDAINLIKEYANRGFYHIMKLLENGENSFNDHEKVKQEIFSRNYDDNGLLQHDKEGSCQRQVIKPSGSEIETLFIVYTPEPYR